MQVSGETMIFRNAHEGRDGTWYTYATGVSSKRKDGTYANKYIDVKFRKGVVVEHKTKINITDGFLTLREYTANGGDVQTVLEIMVLDYEVVNNDTGNTTGFSALNYDDVPF